MKTTGINSQISQGTHAGPLKVAYILHRFPYLTETFIMREMHSMHKHNVDVFIFSLLKPTHQTVHRQARELMSVTRYSPYFSLAILAAQLHFLCRRPIQYLRSFVRMIRLTLREPKVMFRALAIFPKAVFFARQMQDLGIEHAHAHFAWLEGIAAGTIADLIDISFTIHPHAFGIFGRNQHDVRLELESATKVVTVSEYHRRYIDKLCPAIRAEDIEVVHYGVDSQTFRPLPGRPSNRPLRIISVGRLTEKKGHTFLVDACAVLRQRGSEFQCSIVGGGGVAARNALEQRIQSLGLQNHVRLLGALGESDILELYQTSDVFALACITAKNGDQDGMPNVLLEAMACELPVVTTPIAGIPELVEDGVNGRLVPPSDARSLADAIQELLQNEPLRHTFGKSGRERIMQDYDIDMNAQRLARVFHALVRGGESQATGSLGLSVATERTNDVLDPLGAACRR
jgi:glycosyltransferase involved in cell wall biosynthesis